MSKLPYSRVDGRRITATEAAKNFGAIVAQVRESRAVYVVERRGKPVVRISPAEERTLTLGQFAEMLADRSSRVDDGYVRAVQEGIEFLNRPVVPVSPWDS